MAQAIQPNIPLQVGLAGLFNNPYWSYFFKLHLIFQCPFPKQGASWSQSSHWSGLLQSLHPATSNCQGDLNPAVVSAPLPVLASRLQANASPVSVSQLDRWSKALIWYVGMKGNKTIILSILISHVCWCDVIWCHACIWTMDMCICTSCAYVHRLKFQLHMHNMCLWLCLYPWA